MRVLRTIAIFTAIAMTMATGLTHAQSADSGELPDWSGVWQMTSNTVFDQATVQPPGGNANTVGTREFPPYNENWEAIYEANLELVARGQFPDSITTCGTPAGFPRMMNLPAGIEFVVRPEQFWIITEDGPNVMRVYTDGRTHPAPEDRWPTYTGESVGHWEDGTLVFETISLKAHMILDRTGVVLSEQARVVTRMRETQDDLMEAHFAIDDAEALTETWHVRIQYARLPPGTRMIEFACAENNRNPVDEQGRTLTLDREGNILDQL